MTNVCEQCGGELWKPHKDHPEVMLRYIHMHDEKTMREILVIRENVPGMDDEESKKHGRIAPSQEFAIRRILEEHGESDGALLADDMGVGKTVQATEIALRGGFKRGLFIALPDTHDQWVERIYAQSEGKIRARVMNGTPAGRAQLAAFLAGEDGFFIAGSHFLVAQDFESRPVPNPAFNPAGGNERGVHPFLFKRHKTTNPRKGQVKGQLVLRDRPEAKWATIVHDIETPDGGEVEQVAVEVARRFDMIGPAAGPVYQTKSIHLAVFRKMRNRKRGPVDLIVFDEVHVVANKWSQGRRTVLSMRDGAFMLAMSGTWFLNDPDNMWSVTRLAWPGIDPATDEPYIDTNHDVWKTRWMERAPVLDEDGDPRYSPGGVALVKTVGEKEPGAFIATLPCYIRREASDPIPPAQLVYVDPSPAQAAQLEDLQADMLTWVMNWEGEEEPLVTELPPELHIRLRQVTIAELSFDENGEVAMADDAESAKLLPLRNILEKAWAGQPVAIYTDSKIGAHFIARRMQRAGVDARAYTGDLSKPQRRELKRAFLAGEFPYIICTVQSFGVGLDGFQTVCDKVIWISEADGNPAVNAQAIRRFLRPGRLKRRVAQQGEDGQWREVSIDDFQHARLVMRGTVDEISLQNLIHKQWLIRQSITIAA
ncbi:superfamily II DNA or RNA helicase [Microbacterium marinum]|uniref:Superfamily II DNA or RNA helicase n=1 Tax=Microbacterium marinum TaxID=421115 RepID=A0A7W7FJE3_9MICO|nr:helicase-related protein [Microbacterium marinum]MBB4667073.1 superfamily II DNA or RNA helicase [Microbacterium marinum]